MKQLLLPATLMLACGLAWSKIPPPVLDDAAKAKAAEATAKTAWQGKVDAFQLCRVQDKVAAHYRKTAGSASAKDGKAMPVPVGAGAAPGTAAAMVSATPAVAGGTAAAPAGAPTPTPCADPGVFAYTPPEQKPLEAAGAHSPTGTAVSPPSTITPAAAMPAKKS